MGATWGVNRSVAQIHALLYLSDAPLTAEDIAERLGMARSNVSTSLRELLGWNLIRRVHVMGDRRDYYEAEADMFEMVRRIAHGPQGARDRSGARRAAQLRRRGEGRPARPAAVRKRLAAMLEFTETVDRSFGEIMRLPAPTLLALIRMGGAVAASSAARVARSRHAEVGGERGGVTCRFSTNAKSPCKPSRCTTRHRPPPYPSPLLAFCADRGPPLSHSRRACMR